MEDVAFIYANVQEIWFACVCCMVTLVLVGTCEMKIDVSLCDFCKDDCTHSNLLALTFLWICHTNFT